MKTILPSNRRQADDVGKPLTMQSHLVVQNAIRLARAERLPLPPSILVPVDFSAHSRRAVRHAARLAERTGGSIVLLHVVEADPFMTDIRNSPLAKSDAELLADAEIKLNRLAIRELAPTQPLCQIVRRGRVGIEIVRVARERQCDRIVLSVNRRGVIERLLNPLIGSRVAWVKYFAPCPVVTIAGQHCPGFRSAQKAAVALRLGETGGQGNPTE